MFNKKLLIVLICLLIFALIILVGCNSDKESDEIIFDGSYTIQSLSESIYVAQTLPLPNDIGEIWNFAFTNEKIYFSAVSYNYNNTEKSSYQSTTETNLYSMNYDTAEYTKLTGYTPPIQVSEELGMYCFITDMKIDEAGNIWIAEDLSLFKIELPDGFDSDTDDFRSYLAIVDSSKIIRKLDNIGAELLRIDISSINEYQKNLDFRTFAVSSSADTGEDVIILNYSDFGNNTAVIFMINNNGEILFQSEEHNYFERFVYMPDGSVAYPVASGLETGVVSELKLINVETKAIGDTVKLPNIGTQIFNTNGGYDILISDNVNVYGYNAGEDVVVKLINWLESNVVTGSISNIFMTDDERIVCTNFFWGEAMQTELIVLTKILRSELPQKTTLTLAVLEDITYNPLRNEIAEFNKTNLYYNIEVIDYSQYNTEGNGNAGLQRLSNDIVAGNIPDIIRIDYGIPYNDYVRSELFTDIYLFIDADPYLNKEDFIEPALKAAEIEGSLYRVCSVFNILTIVGDSSIVGSSTGWDLHEFEDVLNKNPDADIPFGPWYNKHALVLLYLQINMDNFIDWNTGTSSFDSQEFIYLLELANRASNFVDFENNPNENVSPSEAIVSGRQIANYEIISDFLIFNNYREECGWDIALKGIPTENKNGHYITLYGGFAITERSLNKDAAWSFVRTYLTEDYQTDMSNYGFPINRRAFDNMVNSAQENAFATSFINGVPNPLPTQEEREQMKKDIESILLLLNSISIVYTGEIDEALLNIIYEDASDYFNGRCSAEDAARVIQSKVSNYVSERQ